MFNFTKMAQQYHNNGTWIKTLKTYLKVSTLANKLKLFLYVLGERQYICAHPQRLLCIFQTIMNRANVIK